MKPVNKVPRLVRDLKAAYQAPRSEYWRKNLIRAARNLTRSARKTPFHWYAEQADVVFLARRIVIRTEFSK